MSSAESEKKVDRRMVINGNVYQRIISHEEMFQRVQELAAQIKKDYRQYAQPPILLFVELGALFFLSNLSRALDRLAFDHTVDSIRLKKFTKNKEAEPVKIINFPVEDLGRRHLIVVEDIIDSGESMDVLNQYLKHLKVPPQSVKYCSLLLRSKNSHLLGDANSPVLDKNDSLDFKLDFKIEYYGFLVKPGWVFGEGMDYNHILRGVSGVYQEI
ncbi:MAG: phosphoribosyltransferase family protein [Patescibacteria group bacterium]